MGLGWCEGPFPKTSCRLIGDVFVMKMYYSELGDYEMNNRVVEYELNRRIGWEPEPGRGHPDADFADFGRATVEVTVDVRSRPRRIGRDRRDGDL